MAGGLTLLQGEFTIVALHNLELLVERASRQLLLTAGTLVKWRPTHGPGFQHCAEGINQLIGRLLMARKGQCPGASREAQ